MKISELQKILEQHKQESGDLEVRLFISTLKEKKHIPINNDIVIEHVDEYNSIEFTLLKSMGLSNSEAINKLKEKKLLTTYLDISIYD